MAKITLQVPDDSNITQDQVNKGLELLRKADAAKAKEKARLQDPAYKEKVRLAGQKTLMYQKLMIEKAKKAGITVTAEEIDAALKAKVKK